MVRIFRGRLSKEGFILGHVIILCYSITVTFILAKIISLLLIYLSFDQETTAWILYVLVPIFFILPALLFISLHVRRGHDLNMSKDALQRRGWMIFQHPYWILGGGNPNTNSFGAPPNKNPSFMEILGMDSLR